jgi:exoribonuclease R
MIERGLLPEFSPAALAEADAIAVAPSETSPPVRDLRHMLWASIDNDDSRDLDQLSVAEPLAGGAVKVLVAVADVEGTVREGSAIDGHARTNTTSSKVERRVAKSAAALLLAPRIGDWFDAMVTGASEKGTWARIFAPPAEGRVVTGFEGLDVGDRIRVKLVGTNVDRGFIDFGRANPLPSAPPDPSPDTPRAANGGPRKSE